MEREPERAISAAWYGNKGKSQLVQIYLESYDRRGLLKDLTQIIDQENVNIRQVDTLSGDDDIARLNFTIEVTGVKSVVQAFGKTRAATWYYLGTSYRQ